MDPINELKKLAKILIHNAIEIPEGLKVDIEEIIEDDVKVAYISWIGNISGKPGLATQFLEDLKKEYDVIEADARTLAGKKLFERAGFTMIIEPQDPTTSIAGHGVWQWTRSGEIFNP